tara:strand:+ start:20289 stop:20675 length:387 start_codon:yes stop_codon:yes gene_type:complete
MKWFIPGNVPSSKNSRRWTGKYFIASKAVMSYRKASKISYKKLKNSFIKAYSKYEEPVVISFKFIRGSRHKFDQINPAQTVQDDMVEHGWIEDDNADIILPAFKPYHYDKTQPGVYIEIEENDNKRKS